MSKRMGDELVEAMQELLDYSEGKISLRTSHIENCDKLLFLNYQDGAALTNSTMIALEKIGSAFEGEAERLGLESEDDVVAMIKEIRKESLDK